MAERTMDARALWAMRAPWRVPVTRPKITSSPLLMPTRLWQNKLVAPV